MKPGNSIKDPPLKDILFVVTIYALAYGVIVGYLLKTFGG